MNAPPRPPLLPAIHPRETPPVLIAVLKTRFADQCSTALALEGTCSGEHGIGLHKMEFLRQETGEGARALMRTIKQALDPDNILNPGKIFPLDA